MLFFFLSLISLGIFFGPKFLFNFLTITYTLFFFLLFYLKFFFVL